MYWKYYLPSVVSIVLGLGFLWFQTLAAAIVILGLVAFGVCYAIFVSRLIQDDLEKKRGKNAPAVRGLRRQPDFRGVVTVMAKKSGLTRVK